MTTPPEDTVASKERCPECAERGEDTRGDNLVVYADDHAHCFACGYHVGGNGEASTVSNAKAEGFTPIKGQITALPHRRISEDTCTRYGYRRANLKNFGVVEVANYLKDGKIVGQKVRTKDKKFLTRGDMKNAPLFGQHLCREGGRRLIVTEGELDAMSVYEANGRKYPAVSVPAGAAGAEKAFRNNLQFLNSQDEVVICFDNDEPGQAAAVACAKLLIPGKAKIASLSRKDPNEFLVAGDTKTLVSELWDAQTYRPDGILHVAEVISDESDSVGEIWDYPWEDMTKSLYGRREGELVMHASGSGMGKSTVLREMIHHDLQNGEKVGVLMLEEGCNDTIHDLMSLVLNKPIRRIMAARKVNNARVARGLTPIDFEVEDTLTAEEYNDARSTLLDSGLFLYDHFGSIDSDTLIHRLDYLVTCCGCKKIYLDHVSIVISGQDSGNERKDIDVLMTNLRSFVERTGAHLDAVCHLTKPPGTPFEEGGQISLRDMRGSGALYQLADSCLGYERNQQHTDPLVANTIAVRSLKDRFSGKTGVVAALRYDVNTMRLNPVEFAFDETGTLIYDPHSSTQLNDDPFEVEDTEETDLLQESAA